MLTRWNKWSFPLPIQDFERNSKQAKLFWVQKLQAVGFNIITLPNALYLRWYLRNLLPNRWIKSFLAGGEVDISEGEGARPRAVASGLAGGTQRTCVHSRCLPVRRWPVSKKSTACSGQGTRERLFTRVYRNSCEREAWVYSSVKRTCWLSYPKRYCSVRKREGRWRSSLRAVVLHASG